MGTSMNGGRHIDRGPSRDSGLVDGCFAVVTKLFFMLWGGGLVVAAVGGLLFSVLRSIPLPEKAQVTGVPSKAQKNFPGGELTANEFAKLISGKWHCSWPDSFGHELPDGSRDFYPGYVEELEFVLAPTKKVHGFIRHRKISQNKAVEGRILYADGNTWKIWTLPPSALIKPNSDGAYEYSVTVELSESQESVYARQGIFKSDNILAQDVDWDCVVHGDQLSIFLRERLPMPAGLPKKFRVFKRPGR